jgi:dephospho-CoA kinase
MGYDVCMIISVTGTINSGKDTVGKMLIEKTGWPTFSLPDEMRLVATERGLSLDNQTLNAISVEHKQKYGMGYWAERGLEKFANQNLIVTSLRNPGELVPLQATGEFFLIGVDAPIETRYKRAVARARAGEGEQTLEEFKTYDQFTRNGPPDAQRIDDLFAAANVIIVNDGSLEDLEQKIDAILAEVGQIYRR